MNCFNLFFLLLQKLLSSILMVWLRIRWWVRRCLRLILLLQVDLEDRNLVAEFGEFSLHFWVLCESTGSVILLNCWIDFSFFLLQLFKLNFERGLIDSWFRFCLFSNWGFFVWCLIVLLRKRALYTKKELHDYGPEEAEKNYPDFVHLHYVSTEGISALIFFNYLSS